MQILYCIYNKDEFIANLKLIDDKKYAIVLNKIDEINNERLIEIGKELNEIVKSEIIPLSAKSGFNMDTLKKTIFENIHLKKLFLKIYRSHHFYMIRNPLQINPKNFLYQKL